MRQRMLIDVFKKLGPECTAEREAAANCLLGQFVQALNRNIYLRSSVFPVVPEHGTGGRLKDLEADADG